MGRVRLTYACDEDGMHIEEAYKITPREVLEDFPDESPLLRAMAEQPTGWNFYQDEAGVFSILTVDVLREEEMDDEGRI
jgi:hypothetical protein